MGTEVAGPDGRLGLLEGVGPDDQHGGFGLARNGASCFAAA